MRKKLLILTLVAITQNQSLEEELAGLEEELINAGFDWLVNATIDENLDTSTIEVFTQNGNETLAVFENIQEEKFYKIYLTELNGTQDVFDLRINGSIEFDQILDPAPTMATVKINSTTNKSNESIKGYCKATDTDGDDLIYQYQWYNGSTVYINGTLFKEGSISAGYQHSCGIRANDSRVLCWGEGAFGRQGDGSTADNLVPTLTSDISNYSSVSAGYLHTCGIRANDSRVLCWGDSLYGILGDGQNTTDRTSPYLTTDSSAYSSVSAGIFHTCGIRANDSRVLCWGSGTYGQLGDGESGDNLNSNITTDSSSYTSVSAGRYHTCGIRVNDLRVLCWGESLYGRLGDGQNGVDVLNPNLTTDTSAYSSISAGYEHTCGIRASDGRVLCWGESASYQLGDGQNTLDRNVSTLTTDISPYKKGFTQGNETLVSILSSSNLHAGEIWKLSCRAYDFTSYSSWMNSSIITILGGPPTMATVKINSTVNTKNDSIYGYCNGTDKESDDLAYQYQWYNGSTVYFNGTLFKEGSISAGNYHTCGIRANDSRVLCWGGRNYGALGDGNDSNTDNLNPNVTTDTSSYISVSAGYFYTCGIRANDSRVLCWGQGDNGQLGDGGIGDNLIPTLINDSSPYSSIGAGFDHTCGIRANDSRVLCWGDSQYGQLGDGQNTTDYSNPRVTTDSSPYISISAGYLHTCGIRTNDSRVLCWGAGDYGILGDGQNTTDRYSPYLTTDTSAYKSVSIGTFHTCGIRANDSRVLCWGDSANGKLGDGQVTIDRFEPYPTTDTSAYAQVETTYDHTCGIRANDSRALCWGDNSNGNLGTGNYNPHTSPYLTTDTSPYGRGFSSSEEILVSILGNAYINAGQNWSLGCRSYDFTDYSSWMNSSILTINFPPVIQTVKTNSTTNKSNENIKGYCNATDTDGNDLIYNYTWYNGSTAYINGTLFKEGTISAGYGHSCGIRANDSRVLCWGAGSNGRQGDGQVTDNLIPTLTTDISAYSSVSAGGYFHTCGIRANDSRVLCWGDSAYGQIGDGQITTDRTSPYLTTDSSAYLSISAGDFHTCGIRANDSRVLCWGESSNGRLGNGQTTPDQSNPNVTTDTSAYSSISAGEQYTCGIRANDSRVLCWGDSAYGQLGDGQITTDRTSPYLTTDSSAYSRISAGGIHTCGIRQNDSRVLCWGESLDGRLGDGQDGANVLNPNLTKDSSAYKKGFFSGEEVLISTLMSSFITAGESWKFSCRAYDFIEYSSWVNSTAMTILSSPPTMSTVKINSTTNTKNDPIYGYCNATDEESDDLAYQYQWYNGSTVYFNGTIFKEGSISTGYYFSCGIRANDSRVLCWGQGLYGQLGDGQNTINRTSPTLTTDNSAYTSVNAGLIHTCGIRQNDSRVLCWGESLYGRLGDGQNGVDVLNPNLTTDSSAYKSASAGYYHSCGIRANDSRVLCWGRGDWGNLGDSEITNNLVPNLTTDSSIYSSVSPGGYHTCGIRANDSRVLCWGYGNYGQLGDGNNASHSVLRPNITTDSSPYKKGFSSSEEVLVSILGNAYLNVGQNWSLGCRSYDFTSYSDWMNSSVMTINTAPVMQTVKINSTTNSSTENIKGFCNATDFEGSDLAYQYQWYNGSALSINGTIFKEGSISAGWYSACGIRANDSRVLCWGRCSNDACGDGQTTIDRYTPYPMTDSSEYLMISASNYYTCGIRANDSRVLCWGNGYAGQLGDGIIASHEVGNPTLINDASPYLIITSVYDNTCGIRQSDKRALCWGSGTEGEIGNGNNVDVGTPTLTLDSSAYSSITGGFEYYCGIRTNDSRVLCWGWGDYGELGDSSTAVHNTLFPNLTVDNSSYVKGFSSGNETLVSTLASSFIKKGENWKISCRAYDFTSYSSWMNSTTMTILNGPPVMATVKINSTTNTKNNSIYGYCNATDEESDDLAYQYQWYNGSTVYFNGTLFKEGSISTGHYFSCGIRANDSRVLCWGQGLYGQLGDGQNTINRTSPYLTTDISSYSSISAGEVHTCGIRANDSRVLCWGESQYGRLGDTQNGVDVLNPNLTTDSSPYTIANAGYLHTCGIRTNDSRVLCWGYGANGQVGDGENPNNLIPNITTDSSAYTSVNTGGYHSCGIRANDSRVLCWGFGTYGQLGDGSNASHNTLNPNITTDSSPYKKGFSSSEEVLVSILGNAYLNVGQNWSFGCRAYDFTNYSSWMNSSILIVNTAPIMRTVKINSTTNSSTENIKGYCNATDFEGSNLAYGYTWYNGSTVYFDGTYFRKNSLTLGENHVCGIRANDSRVLCWGECDSGKCGDGNISNHDVGNPNLTTDTSAYSIIAAGGYHTCGIRANDSRVLCWGLGGNGELGNGSISDSGNPQITSDNSAYSMITTGYILTCGIRKSDSRVLRWGYCDQYGTCGDGNFIDHNNLNPTLTTDSSSYSTVKTNDMYACGIRNSDSRVLCWG